jgi:hypothetical protein
MRPSYLLFTLAALTILAGPASADWDPGDPCKMHFPQLPDPNGWDVQTAAVPADDWRCTETGPVTDVHFWYSWRADNPGEITAIQLEIFGDDRTGEFSQPGEFLWRGNFAPGEFTQRLYGDGDQGFYNPNLPDGVFEHDHSLFYQVNIENIPDPFVQEIGNIYWLEVSMPHAGSAPGWKTSRDHFEDIAVYWDSDLGVRQPLLDPLTGEQLSLAFVITPEPGSLTILALGVLCATRARRAGRNRS